MINLWIPIACASFVVLVFVFAFAWAKRRKIHCGSEANCPYKVEAKA
jgi:hypothetical protein